MRKNIATRKGFPHNDSVVKILFLNIRNFTNRWTRQQGWDTVMSQLLIPFGERLKPNLTDSL
jgi:putative transposase